MADTVHVTDTMREALTAIAHDPAANVWKPIRRELERAGLIEWDQRWQSWWPTDAGFRVLEAAS